MTGPESAANRFREARGQSGAPRDDAPAAPSPRWLRVVVHPAKPAPPPPPPAPATPTTTRRPARRRTAPRRSEPAEVARGRERPPAAELLRDDRGRELVKVGSRVYRPTWQDLDPEQLSRF